MKYIIVYVLNPMFQLNTYFKLVINIRSYACKMDTRIINVYVQLYTLIIRANLDRYLFGLSKFLNIRNSDTNRITQVESKRDCKL